VLDPFMGIGSTAVVAMQESRNAVGFELKETYWKQAVRNAERAQVRGGEQISIFDLLTEEPEEVAA